MNPTTIEILASAFFLCAVVHTFMVKKIEHFSHSFPEGSISRHVFHILGEVVAVFGIWSLFFLVFYTYTNGFMNLNEAHHLVGGTVQYIQSGNYTEPLFVFVIMCMAGTRPVIHFAERMIKLIASFFPIPQKMAFYASSLIIGPLLGSFITEPAAMTVTAVILLEYFYQDEMSLKFKYATIGLLFVNISIGGTLTHFAAPPVLMVAAKWNWDMAFMVKNFGYKAILAVG